MRHAKFHPKDNLIKLVDSLHENGFLGFDVTGGEPTLHPDIVEVIAHATSLGLSSRIITLGQWLGRPMKNTGDRLLVEALMDVGLTNFLFSVHAVEDGLFEKITGESWERLSNAMAYCEARNFHFTTNTTVYEDNYRHLPVLAKHLAERGTYLHNFIVQNAYYQWGKSGRAENVQAHYGEIAPYLREAVATLEDAAIGVNIRYAPMCTVAGLEKNVVGIVGVRYDPYEWMNRIDHYGGDPVEMGKRIDIVAGDPSPGASMFGVTGKAKTVEVGAARGHSPNVAKLFPQNCAKCHAINVCDGVDPRYLGERGADEFIPYVGADPEGRGNTLDKERLTYHAPFFVKRKPDADMKSVIRRTMKPTPVSASPKVSVIVTCYNYGKYLRECLDSLLAQTWENTEIILVDDGSTDDTSIIARDYAPHITYVWQQNSGQPAYPRNEGIKLSTGELVMCLDADDKLVESYIEECVRQFQRHPEASIIWTGTQCFGTAEDMFCAAPYDFRALLRECRIVCSAMYRREVWEAVGGYRTNTRGAEDWGFWIEAGGLGYFGVPVPRQLFFYRRHADGIFETDVMPNHDAKARQIILNNSDLYEPETVQKARDEMLALAAE